MTSSTYAVKSRPEFARTKIESVLVGVRRYESAEIALSHVVKELRFVLDVSVKELHRQTGIGEQILRKFEDRKRPLAPAEARLLADWVEEAIKSSEPLEPAEPIEGGS